MSSDKWKTRSEMTGESEAVEVKQELIPYEKQPVAPIQETFDEVKELLRVADKVLSRSLTIKSISGKVDRDSVSAAIKAIKTALSKATQIFKPFTEFKRETDSAKKNLTQPLGEEEVRLKKLASAYDNKERAKLAETARTKQEELDKKQKEAKAKAIGGLISQGKVAEAREMAGEQVQQVKVLEKVPEKTDISVRTYHKVEVVNRGLVIRASAQLGEPYPFLDLNMTAIGKKATESQGKFTFPGLRFYTEKGEAFRG